MTRRKKRVEKKLCEERRRGRGEWKREFKWENEMRAVCERKKPKSNQTSSSGIYANGQNDLKRTHTVTYR